MLSESKVSDALGVSQQLASEIGQRLRMARTEQGKSTQQLANRIKVNEHYVHSIENGQWNELPRGLNGRGIVRNYARELSVSLPELEPVEIKNHMNSQVHPYEVSSSISQIERPNAQTSTPRVPLQNSKQIPRRPIDAAKPIAQQPTRRTQRHAFSDVDDDTPMDIVTPDVAKILGLPSEKNIKDTKKRADAQGIPEVDAHAVVAELIKAQENAPVTHSEKEAQSYEISTHAPQEPIQNNVTHALPSQPPPQQPLIEEATIRPDSSIPTLLVQEHQKELETTQNRGQRVLYIAAAAILAVATGAYIGLRQNRSNSDAIEVPAQQESVKNEVVAAEPVTSPAPEAAAASQVTVAPESQPTAVAAQTSAIDATTATTATTPPAAAQTAAPQAQATVAPIANAAGVPQNATLKVSSDVDMRIVVDDKVVFSGTKTAGEVPVTFKDHAEIFVKDGSKVSLVYDGWDHGPLGHDGRKRRIVLSAQTPE